MMLTLFGIALLASTAISLPAVRCVLNILLVLYLFEAAELCMNAAESFSAYVFFLSVDICMFILHVLSAGGTDRYNLLC